MSANDELEKTLSFNSEHEKEVVEEMFSTNTTDAFTPTEAEKRLIRKINLNFIPFVFLIFFIQFLDKTSLSTVSVIHAFFVDTKIDSNKYSWVGSMFYLGFLCMQLPNNYMLQKLPVSKYIGTVLVIWGVCLLCTAWATNFGQLLGLRFLLGFFEAVTYPAMFLLIATMYRRSEQVIWLGDRADFHWFRLTEEEKLIVKDRTRDNAVVSILKINYDQIKESLKESRFYCYCFISMFINFQNGALTVFSNIIIAGLGFSSTNAVLLSIPSGAVLIIMILISTHISKRINEIILVAMIVCAVSLVGLIILTAAPSVGVKLLGLYLCGASTPCYILLQASISSNVSGYTKKIFYISGNMIFYTFGNFIDLLLFRAQDAPRYIMGMSVYAAANVLVILLFSYVRYTYAIANKKRQLHKNMNAVVLHDDLKDITDVQNLNFVYRT